jgi:Glyoxalase-like domain
MHKSRLAGFIVDCHSSDIDHAAKFWGGALGMPIATREGDLYVKLDAGARDLAVEVQRVQHVSRVHLDIESDNVDAEMHRLEALGARRVALVKTWWVMEAPTGQRFCVIRAKGSLEGKPGVTEWP